MKVEPRYITLKDGRKCILRNAVGDDAAKMIHYLKVSSAETEYILRYPDEAEKSYSIEKEIQILENNLNSPRDVMIVAEIDGVIAGNCALNGLGTKRKLSHRAVFGIALMKEFWGLGIGTALMEYILEISDLILKYQMVELEVVSENKRAISLYEKMGFKKIGSRPFALKLDSGGYYAEDLMNRMNPGMQLKEV